MDNDYRTRSELSRIQIFNMIMAISKTVNCDCIYLRIYIYSQSRVGTYTRLHREIASNLAPALLDQLPSGLRKSGILSSSVLWGRPFIWNKKVLKSCDLKLNATQGGRQHGNIFYFAS